jgi:hypothetical protein
MSLLSVHIKPNGRVDVVDKETPGGPAIVELWAVDAMHALKIDPKRYALPKPKAERPAEGEAEEV